MKVLVITACTAEKKHERSNQLQPADFATTGLLKRKSIRLKEFETPAAQMYTGNGHLHLMNGVRGLRRSFGPGVVDVRIISPGYGLLNEENPIVPYDYTFHRQGREQIRQRSRRLEIHPEVEHLLSSYDLVFFLLGKDYVTACLLPFRVPNPVTQIFLVAPSLQDSISADLPYVHAVCAGVELAHQLQGATRYYLKGVVFEKLCTVACDRGHRVFEEVKRNPQRIIEMVLDCNRGF